MNGLLEATKSMAEAMRQVVEAGHQDVLKEVLVEVILLHRKVPDRFQSLKWKLDGVVSALHHEIDQLKQEAKKPAKKQEKRKGEGKKRKRREAKPAPVLKNLKNGERRKREKEEKMKVLLKDFKAALRSAKGGPKSDRQFWAETAEEIRSQLLSLGWQEAV
jgi:hypothetical protein